MDKPFIKRYKVYKHYDSLISTEKLKAKLDTLDGAFNWVRDNCNSCEAISIVEFKYTSKENIDKDIHFDCVVKWDSRFHGWEGIL